MIAKLPSEREQISSIAERWRRQYPNDDQVLGAGCSHQTAGAIHRRLLALSSSSTPADVAAIIGNASWIGIACTECRYEELESTAVVSVGSDDVDETVLYLCVGCVSKLHKLASKH
jgi:hypothetical protein